MFFYLTKNKEIAYPRDMLIENVLKWRDTEEKRT